MALTRRQLLAGGVAAGALTAGGVYEILRRAWETLPGVYDIPEAERWTGFRPTRREKEYEQERHFERTAVQERHDMDARRDRAFHYSDNHGRPPIAATSRPGEFHGRDRGARPDRHDFRPREDNGYRGGQNDRNFSPNTPAHEQGHNFGEASRGNPAPHQREMSAPRNDARSESRQHNEGSSDRGHGHDGGDNGHDNGHR